MISYINHTLIRREATSSTDGKYAWVATVGEKGQIVIPKRARDVFGIKPGDTLLLLGDAEKGIAIPPEGAFAELFNILYGDKR